MSNMSGAEANTSNPDTPSPTISLPLFLEQSARIAKLEKEKLVLLDRIADLKRELLLAGLGIRLAESGQILVTVSFKNVQKTSYCN